MTIIYNKQSIPSDHPCIRSNDRGFTLGHGLFETILVKYGVIPALDYHWRRLNTSAPLMDIALPFDQAELRVLINQLINENNLTDKIAGARVTVTHGESERGLLPIQKPIPQFLISVFECPKPSDKPLTALIVNTRKNEHSLSSRIKSISYLDNILAKKEAYDQHYDEAILLNTASHVADGSMSNIYMVKEGQIYTPAISEGALPGTVRSILLEECNAFFSFIEKSISVEELFEADEVFLTNALMGIKSITQINHQKFDSFVVTNNIRKILRERKDYV